jgi:hypothetical protein
MGGIAIGLAVAGIGLCYVLYGRFWRAHRRKGRDAPQLWPRPFGVAVERQLAEWNMIFGLMLMLVGLAYTVVVLLDVVG